jgi:glyceraldehyde 3-phosphate dehydrogenase
LAHLLKNDTVHGKFPFDVKVKGSSLIVDGKELKILAEPDPAKLPWKDMDFYVAVESTGRFRIKEAAGKHLTAGAKKVNLVVATTYNAPGICMSIKNAAKGIIKKGEVNDGLLNKVEIAFRAYDPLLGFIRR